MKPATDVIAAPVVRELVDRNEGEIESLRQELTAALQEAEEAERRVAAHARPRLPLSWDDLTDPGTTMGAGPVGPARPRTTVVTRAPDRSAQEPGAQRPPTARSTKPSKRWRVWSSGPRP
jgi:hypothetical protein